MKRHSTLQELAQELQTENAKKYDIVVPSSRLKMVEGQLTIQGESLDDALTQVLAESGISQSNAITLDVMNTAHGQISDKLGIPKKYYDRIIQHPELLDENVNYWLERANKNYFLRCFVDEAEQTGVIRAFLSDKFKVIDNYDVLMAALEAVKDSGVNLQIQDCDVTDKKMYVRFIAPEVEIDSPELLKNYRVPNGSPNQGKTGIISGFVISNSEIGYGQFSISPRAGVLACSNGMIFHDDAFKKTHLGAQMDAFSSIQWSEDTRQKNIDLIIAQVKDAINTYISEDYFAAKVQHLEEVGKKELEHPFEVVKNVSKNLQFSEDRQADLLNYFTQGADVTAFGVCQAMTYYGQVCEDAELQFDMEKEAVAMLENVEAYDKPMKKRTVKATAAAN
jgi:hypothetical protein